MFDRVLKHTSDICATSSNIWPKLLDLNNVAVVDCNIQNEPYYTKLRNKRVKTVAFHPY